MNIYGVYDKVAGIYVHQLYLFVNDGVCIRALKNAIKDNVEDYAIYKLGVLDDATGNILPANEFVYQFTKEVA